MKRLLKLAAMAAFAVGLATAPQTARAQDTIKLGYTELLSGTFAQVGDQGIKTIQFVIDGINAN